MKQNFPSFELRKINFLVGSKFCKHFRKKVLSSPTPKIPKTHSPVSNLRAVPLPQLQIQRRPDGHEHREEDRRWVVHEMRDLRKGAALRQLPVIAVLVAQRAHRHVKGADVMAYLVLAGRGPGVEDAEQSHEGLSVKLNREGEF